MNTKLNSSLRKLWSHLSKARQRQFFLILILMLVASVAEIISLSVVIPFLGVLTAPEQIFQYSFLQPLIQFFNIENGNQLIFPITVIFILSALFAGIIRLTLLYSMTRLSYATGADLSINIYKRTLYQEYAIHISRNSSEVINGIITKTNTVVHGIITPMLLLVSSIILLFGIMSALLTINFSVAMSAFLVFGIVYLSIVSYTRFQLKDNSQIISSQSNKMVQSLQEGLGGIRDVIIDSSQQFYCKLYRKADLPLRRALGTNQFIGGSPRFAMESFGMMLIAIFAYYLTLQEGGITSAIPLLGALALGAQRLMPALQQCFSSFSTIKGSEVSFNDVLELLDQPLTEFYENSLISPIPFNTNIKLINLSFRYSGESPWVLKDIDLEIIKGERVGFIGATGNGKSTLIDILMGLLAPTSGSLTIDGTTCDIESRRAWQSHIAHVPQNIFLSDSSIEENIAFGIPKDQINHKKVEQVANQAQLKSFIQDLKEGYQSFVGERGVRLSGGQRQRIGIARAFYKNADVLIFDEATSALDNKTERLIMESIKKLNKDITVLIIAHRLSTLKNCDKIFELSHGSIKSSSITL